MNLDDPRWRELKGGYNIPYNPVPALLNLGHDAEAWHELWDNLHHQGDLGLASYAAVPQIVHVCKTFSSRDWNPYALACTIEIERHRKTNPSIPDWLRDEYEQAWHELFDLALADVRTATDPVLIQAIVSTLALARGSQKLGTLITNLDDSEIDELLEERHAWSSAYNSQQDGGGQPATRPESK